ncbi:carbohydrate binding family 9 domain-containing protein [Lewinella sp. W8]|uniref:carbohydrate binding family 9 domain-containing protein n=1 Tax=Lewinella sp. W8 TaxID=2528208 RepID=UPI0010687EAD|nr:carbohydrate binding family 9 domain-containing protein [Lewinella sp. W8]MTB52749.1 hydrolase [Lewinella sp. W8]
MPASNSLRPALAAGLLLWLFLPLSLAATDTERPVARAMGIDAGPEIDGEVRQDPIWASVPAFGDLTQAQPSFGQAASEPTEIRVAYTDEVLYVSVVCFDTAPDALVVSDARRDASLDDMDAFLFILDTYKDNQNGFVFGTNSVGIEYDAQVDNEGQGNFNANRQQGGTIGGFNLNWDGAWEVKTQVGDFGWSAEFAIPLSTIRFQTGKDWGINFRRNIRKTNEIAYWAPMPIGLDLNRLSLAGTLTGLDLKSPGNLKVIPYVLGQVARDNEAANPSTDFTPEVGGDIKYSITPSLTLDLTYNTDFAQVEVDDQQVNLDRFNLFFPEKRPFFLENAGLFSVGSPGEVDLFFSRRIGIADDGSQVPIIGGARLSGKLNRTNVGFLSMVTDDVDAAGIGKNNFTVARVNHEFQGRSALGAAFISRTGVGHAEDDFNRVMAVDGKLGLGDRARMSGFLATSNGPGDEEQQHAFKWETRYNWNNLEMRLGYTEVGEGFNPEVGFLLREAFRKPEALVLYHLRPKKKNSKILEHRPHISYRSYWDFNGNLQTSFLHIDNHWEYKSGLEFHTGINFRTEGVVDSFEISPDVFVPPGTYDHAEAQLVFFTNPSNPVSINLRSVMGGSFGGSRYVNSGTLRLRFGDKFNSEFTYLYNIFRLPGGNFNANIFRSRLSYSFTPNLFVQSLIQNNQVTDLWAVNLRLGWLQRANTGLFIVYNHNVREGGTLNNSIVLKFSRMFDVLR